MKLELKIEEMEHKYNMKTKESSESLITLSSSFYIYISKYHLLQPKSNLKAYVPLCYEDMKTVLVNILIIAGNSQFPAILAIAENCCKTTPVSW